jgi:hypothetical protein
MVSDKTGPIVSIIGSILMITFGFLFFGGHNLETMLSGQELVFIRLGFALGIGAAGLIGGILALKGMWLGNMIPLIGAIIAIVGLYLPIGSMFLYSTYFIEVFLMPLGTGLSLLNKLIERNLAEEAVKLAKGIAENKKVMTVMFNYIVENKGKAFTAESIYKRCIKETQFNLSISETEKLLDQLNVLGKVSVDFREDAFYYFIS